MSLKKYIPLFALVLFVVSCSTSPQKASDNTENESESNKTESASDLHLFALPAPLQVSSMLKAIDVPYNEKIIIPSKNKLPIYSSNYYRALALGVYTVDLAYATVYDQRQNALDYAKSVQTMAQDLGITSGISKHMVNRFESNISKQDSLCKIILESYGKAHEYFQTNKREEVGLYILAGSYIESLWLTLNFKNIPSDERLASLIGQQKNYLNNIIELIQYTEPTEEMLDLMQKLLVIQQEFEPIKVEYHDTTGGQVSVKCNLTLRGLHNLLEKTSSIRKQIIAG